MNQTRWVCVFGVLFIFSSVLFPTAVHAVPQFSPSSVNFGSVPVNTSSVSVTITITHTVDATMYIQQIASSLPEFVVTSGKLPITVPAKGSATIQVTFRPNAAATFAGTITVYTHGAGQSATGFHFLVSGRGVAAAAVQPQLSVVPSSVNFGNVAVGVTNSQTMTIQNPGTASLTVTQAALSGASYATSGLTLPLSIAPGGSARFNISFAPASATTLPGSLTLVSNAPTSPTSVSLGGAGVAKLLQLQASATSLNFGSLATGSSAAQNVTVTNTGNSAVTISQIAATGTGLSTGGLSLPVALAAGQSTSFSVTWAPASAGNLTGSVTVTSNAANSPLVIALAGTATSSTHSVTLTWTPSSSSYQGFHVYRGSVSGGPYARIDASLVPSSSYSDSNVTAGQTYYYVATQVDSSGNESAYSGEVSAVVP